MTATIIGRHKPQSPEWHAARLNGIGGSEVAAILGLSKWESPFSLWHRKRGEIGQQTENPQMSWGTRLEPVILDAFFENHPELYRSTENGTWANWARPWQRANPDEIAHDERGFRTIVEVKTAMYADEWGPAGTDEIPVYYRCQVQWYMDCLGIDCAVVCVLIAGSDYREYPISYSPADAHLLRGKAAAFIRSVRHDVRPDIDGSTATYQTVKTLPEGVTDEVAEIRTMLASEYRAALAEFKVAEERKRRTTSLILDAIGDGKYANTEDGTRVATRSVTKDGRTHSLRPAKETAA